MKVTFRRLGSCKVLRWSSQRRDYAAMPRELPGSEFDLKMSLLPTCPVDSDHPYTDYISAVSAWSRTYMPKSSYFRSMRLS